MKKNNPFSEETSHTVPVGEPAAGKTEFSAGLIFARSDVSQLKHIYGSMSQNERDKFVRTIKTNTTFRMNLKK